MITPSLLIGGIESGRPVKIGKGKGTSMQRHQTDLACGCLLSRFVTWEEAQRRVS